MNIAPLLSVSLASCMLSCALPAAANTGGDPMDSAFAHYQACVRSAALRLDTPTASVESVIHSAESACNRERGQLVNTIGFRSGGITADREARARRILALEQTNRQVLARLIAFYRENHAPNN